MSYLLSNGCSHTYGDGIEYEIGYESDVDYDTFTRQKIEEYQKQHNFSTFISNELGLSCVNLSRVGSSNEEIIYSTIDYLQNVETLPSLVLINLTGPGRKLYYFDKKMVTIDYKFKSNVLDNIFHELGEKNKLHTWFEMCQRFFINEHELIQKNEHLIRYISSYLETKNIPYFISNTMRVDYNISKITSNSIDISMFEYLWDLMDNGEDVSHEPGFHWLSNGHRRWGQYLLEHLKEKGIIGKS